MHFCIERLHCVYTSLTYAFLHRKTLLTYAFLHRKTSLYLYIAYVCLSAQKDFTVFINRLRLPFSIERLHCIYASLMFAFLHIKTSLYFMNALIIDLPQLFTLPQSQLFQRFYFLSAQYGLGFFFGGGGGCLYAFNKIR